MNADAKLTYLSEEQMALDLDKFIKTFRKHESLVIDPTHPPVISLHVEFEDDNEVTRGYIRIEFLNILINSPLVHKVPLFVANKIVTEKNYGFWEDEVVWGRYKHALTPDSPFFKKLSDLLRVDGVDQVYIYEPEHFVKTFELVDLL